MTFEHEHRSGSHIYSQLEESDSPSPLSFSETMPNIPQEDPGHFCSLEPCILLPTDTFSFYRPVIILEIQKSLNFHLPSDVDLVQLLFLPVNWIICVWICHYQGKKILKYSKALFLFKSPFAVSLSFLPLVHISLIFCSLISGSRQLDAITQQPVSQAWINLFIICIGYRKKLD